MSTRDVVFMLLTVVLLCAMPWMGVGACVQHVEDRLGDCTRLCDGAHRDFDASFCTCADGRLFRAEILPRFYREVRP